MSTDPTIYDELPSDIIVAGPTRHMLKFFGLYNTIISNEEPNKYISYTILFFMQLFHISALVTLFAQPSFRDFTFSIPTFIPLIFFTIYLLIYYFPSWAKSDNIKNILKHVALSRKFNKIMVIFSLLEILCCLPMYIVLIIYNPESYRSNNNVVLDVFAKLFNILIIPYGFITHTYLALLYSTLCVFTDYTCQSIKEYSNNIKNNIKSDDFYNKIKDYQNKIENWCQSSYDIIGKPIGIISTIIGIAIITGIFFVVFINSTSSIIIIDAISIIIYGSLIDFLLWKTSSWHTTFNHSFSDWKNNIEYIPFINKNFQNNICFNKWLDEHESHSFRLFGRNGIKVDYNLIFKLVSLTCSLSAYVASKLFDDYIKSA